MMVHNALSMYVSLRFLSLLLFLKVGEALVQSLHRCGQAMPIYAPRIIPIFIQGAQPSKEEEKGIGSAQEKQQQKEEMEEQAHYRASCLSGLAEICELLGWSLRRYFTEIMDLSMTILTREQQQSQQVGSGDEDSKSKSQASTLVRRAAAYLMERMIKGAGPERILAVWGKNMTEMEQALQRTAERDR